MTKTYKIFNGENRYCFFRVGKTLIEARFTPTYTTDNGIMQKAIEEGQDIKSTTQIVELSSQRVMVKDTDKGRELIKQIEDLKKLLAAYRIGMIKERVVY